MKPSTLSPAAGIMLTLALATAGFAALSIREQSASPAIAPATQMVVLTPTKAVVPVYTPNTAICTTQGSTPPSKAIVSCPEPSPRTFHEILRYAPVADEPEPALNNPEPTATPDSSPIADPLAGYTEDWSSDGKLCQAERAKDLTFGWYVESCDPLRVLRIEEAKEKGLL